MLWRALDLASARKEKGTRRGNYAGDSVLSETVVIFASVGLFLLVFRCVAFSLVIWLTNKYPDMKRRDFKNVFDRDPD